MAQHDGFQVSFQKRTTKGLDSYEHEQASATLNVTFGDEDNVSEVVDEAARLVRGQVYHTLGLANAPAVGETRQPAQPEKTPTQQAREKAAPSHPNGPPKDENGKPVAPSNLKNVRGQNAVKLADHLKAVHDAGNPVPDAQIYRLPKGWQTEVRNYVEGKGQNAQESGPDADARESADPGENAEAQESAGSHDDPPVVGDPEEGDWHEGPGDPLEGAEGDAPDATPADTDGDEDIDDLMSGDPQPPQEDVSDAKLQEKLREFKGRFGGAKEIKAALQTFAGEKGGAGDIPTKDRPQFLQTLEQRASEKGV